ncbi:MAG TPA: thioredoxin family protein [Terriglobales bacterium]|nr:thioredoxin family protein [Terriglobales bacterium]
MKFCRLAVIFIALLTFITAGFAAKIGEPAPNFTATDSNGKTEQLSAFKGKFVVLEWHNRSCPFTQKHYTSHNMQNLQKEWTSKGVVWLTVISSAPGKQGYVTAEDENAYVKQMGASPTAVLLDPTGALGHLYDAKTTPHLFIISPDGVLIYNGAIDDHASTDASDIPNSKNYVEAALAEATAGKPVTTPSSRPYGCSVKYAE